MQVEPPALPEAPVQTESPVQVEPTALPESPVQTESPVQVEPTALPESPVQTESPVQVESPAQAETPVQTETPVQIEPPAQADTPVQVETPVRVEVSPQPIVSAPTITVTESKLTEQSEAHAVALVDKGQPNSNLIPDHMKPAAWIALASIAALFLLLLVLWIARHSTKHQGLLNPASTPAAPLAPAAPLVAPATPATPTAPLVAPAAPLAAVTSIIPTNRKEAYNHSEDNLPARPDLGPYRNSEHAYQDERTGISGSATSIADQQPSTNTEAPSSQQPKPHVVATPAAATHEAATQTAPHVAAPQPPATTHFATSPATPHLAAATPPAATRVAPQALTKPVEKTQQSVERKHSLHNDEPSISNEHYRFGQWLKTLPELAQQEYSIDLLIYWIAYADNRFDQESKTKVFQMSTPDDSNLVKRWAFKQDALALNDAIEHIKIHTQVLQREQIINLLMTLLVNEKALTPVQNNLLRFIADAFGVGKAYLAKIYHLDYGESIPPLPRPDKLIWWEGIDADQMLRWDARELANQSDQIRYRATLGQPLRGELSQTSVESSYQRAVRRCLPERASELGVRERLLLSTHSEKYRVARNALMETFK